VDQLGAGLPRHLPVGASSPVVIGRALAALIAMTVVALGLAALRRPLAAWLIADGRPQAQRALRGAAGVPSKVAPASLVRVVVLDGLSRADAHLPALDALCARGADLAIDVGFPTKSLPVQAVLWSGLTAQQLGLGPHNDRATGVPGTLPVRFPDSLAVAESWSSIARAVGFARVIPAPAADRAREGHDPAAAAAWAVRFPDQAVAAAAGPVRLVLIHLLAIDEAAHAHGRHGASYRDALAAADRTLARVLAARPDATWLVLADHGHVDGGGHGDAELALRIVRGCVAPFGITRGAVHLVDVARHLRDLLGVAPEADAVGRPLAIALAAPDPDATLPRLPVTRALAAALVLVLAFGATLCTVRPRWTVAWLPVAALGYLIWQGPPSLSARDPRAAALCAVLAAIPARIGLQGHRRRVSPFLIPALGAVVAAGLIAGVPAALVDGTAPATPIWTAVLELVATVGAVALTGAAGWLAWSAAPDSAGRSGGEPAP